MTTGEVPGLVAAKVGGDAAQLVDRVIVASNPPLGILVIRTIGTDPEETSKLAQTFSDQLVASLTKQLTKAYDATTQGCSARSTRSPRKRRSSTPRSRPTRPRPESVTSAPSAMRWRVSTS